MHLDFFGEPVTFLEVPSSVSSSSSSSDKQSKKSTTTNNDNDSPPPQPRLLIGNAMAAMDNFVLAVVSRGKTCTEGGEEAGLYVQPAHAAAIAWSEALRFASVWNENVNDNNNNNENDDRGSGGGGGGGDRGSAPMLAVAVLSPLLVQAGVAYARNLDTLLKQARPVAPGLPPLQLDTLATAALRHMDHPLLSERERGHLRALECLWNRDDPASALVHLLHLLRLCPGDALALSLALDLAQAIGNKRAALRAAGTAASYWQERGGGWLRPSIPGHAMASSLVALGLAVAGRVETAEPLADQSMKRGRGVAGALATWAQAHVFDAGGRVAEGISALANGDGIANYEGSGFMFFDSRLGGYGARFALDREERGRGKSRALRLYDDNFQRVLDYSGFSEGRPWTRPQEKAPLGWNTNAPLQLEPGSDSLFSRLFSRNNNADNDQQQAVAYEITTQGSSAPSTRLENWDPSCEDVLTWLPPTPQFLADATLLLLRFTLNGTIARSNHRWASIRKAWEAMLSIQKRYDRSLVFCPLASVAATLLLSPTETGADQLGTGRLGLGLHLMGEQLRLGEGGTPAEQATAVMEFQADREPDFWLPSTDDQQSQWKKIVDHLSSTLDEDLLPDSESEETNRPLAAVHRYFQTWDFDGRPICEHAIVYACCKSGDLESLCLARSICGQGVVLRPNSPEEWWRYSIVLGLLGDEVASEDALNTSINVGAGQGARAV